MNVGSHTLPVLLAVLFALGCQSTPEPAALSAHSDELNECRVQQPNDASLETVVTTLESRTIEAWMRKLPRTADEPPHPVLAATRYRPFPTGFDRAKQDVAICGLPKISIERRGGEQRYWLRLVEPWTNAVTWHGPFELSASGEVVILPEEE
ncbi:MAG: hypothetical protein EA377_08425 [Phycisphaerales bacterium]|nr:MAG: hypothetical protein EA377_08425 [Phycisphaerales bacterium]